jgi:hypothetical protein
MNHTIQLINVFLSEYETEFNMAFHGNPDIETTAKLFTESFAEANSSGITCRRNDYEFRKYIAEKYAFYKNIGLKEMRIVSRDISMLNDIHGMDKVKWKAIYETKQGKREELEFEVIYLVQVINGDPRIFAYITGDENRALKEKGLIAN